MGREIQYVFGCRLNIFRLCDSDFVITPVDDIIIGITCAVFCFHIAHISFAIIIIIIIIISSSSSSSSRSSVSIIIIKMIHPCCVIDQLYCSQYSHKKPE